MIIPNPSSGTKLQTPARANGLRKKYNRRRHARASLLSDALAREKVLLSEKCAFIRRQTILAEEFEHRLVNGLQSVISLLSLQSRAASTAEVAAQLTAAANRVAALARVHRQLHLHDHQQNLNFKPYLEQLCQELSGLVFQERPGHVLLVEGVDLEMPTVLGITLGFVANELITNSAKYGDGRITVRLESTDARHSLSVFDDGPGLPAGFDPAGSKGLGMKIVQSLVNEIGGKLAVAPGGGGAGARFTVTFGLPPR